MPDVTLALVAGSVALTAAVTDVRTGRIPNLLTFGAGGAALLAHAAIGAWDGFQTAALGWLIGLLLFLPLFLLGGMGAGDVKLLAALGAWLGPWEVLWLAVYASIAGGVLAVFVAARHRYLRTALGNIGNLLRYWCLAGLRPAPWLNLNQQGAQRDSAPRLAYAVPICVGTLVALWR